MTHTKGPWKAGAMSVGTDKGDDSQAICCMIGEREYEEHEANARLIAAAPELLVIACSLLRDDGHYLECPCPGDYGHEHMPRNKTVKFCVRIQAAIAKAKAETA